MLRNSQLIPTILDLSQHTTYKHESERPIRQGYMAAVIKLANFLQKHKQKEEVHNYISEFPDW